MSTTTQNQTINIYTERGKQLTVELDNEDITIADYNPFARNDIAFCLPPSEALKLANFILSHTK